MVYNATYEIVDCSCCMLKRVTNDTETYTHYFLNLISNNKLEMGGKWPDQITSGTLVWHLDIKTNNSLENKVK
jgi:hypothetical protein